MRDRRRLLAAIALAGLWAAPRAALAQQVGEFAYSPQLTLSGVTDALQASANYGRGVVFADIDSGAVPWAGFATRISPDSSCVIAGCTSWSDGYGHGTFTAAQMVGANMGNGVVGEAPAGTLLAVKVLGDNGTGLVSDVANGMLYAAQHGAMVQNLSLSLSFTPQMIAAINYAAARGNIIVFAGGNSAALFNGGQNITGLTDQAIGSIILMGSTSASQVKSSFSNTPGTAGFVSTTGQFQSFASRWLMADGENIWGASNFSTPSTGYTWYTQMSGTSMAAPQASAAAGLLEARWPFLAAWPQAVTLILLQSAQDLGAPGQDPVYGQGFINLANAFQPIGPLTEPIGGKDVPVASILSRAILASTALGNLPSLSERRLQIEAFDFFNRNFTVALALPVATKPSAAGPSVAAAQVSGAAGAGARSFTDLGDGRYVSLSLTSVGTQTVMPGTDKPNPGLIQDPSQPGVGDWSIGFAQKYSYIGVGQGSGAALSFGEARWDGKTAFLTSNAEVSGSLLALANSSGFAAAGLNLTATSRVAIAFTAASGSDPLQQLAGQGASAQGTALGYTFKPAKHWQVSLTAAFLAERNEYLGGQSSGATQLGGTAAATRSFGIGNAVDLGDGYGVGVDMAWAVTDATQNRNSLISGTSGLTSFAFGAAFSKERLFGDHDALELSAKKPLRVYGGTATLTYGAGTDMNGQPILATSRSSLVPGGSETDLGVAYGTPVADGIRASVNLMYRNDADNVAGARDGAMMTRLKIVF